MSRLVREGRGCQCQIVERGGDVSAKQCADAEMHNVVIRVASMPGLLEFGLSWLD